MPTYRTTELPVSDLHEFTTTGRVVAVLPATTKHPDQWEGQRPNRIRHSYVHTVLVIEEVADAPE